MNSKFNLLVSLLIWLGFCLLALGQLQRFQVTPSITIYAHDIVFSLIVILLGWRELTTKKQATLKSQLACDVNILKTHWWITGLVAVIACGWVAQFFQGGSLLYASLYATRILIYSLAIMLMVRLKPWAKLLPEYQASTVIQALVLFTGIVSLVLGLAQYVVLPDTRFLSILGWDDHYFRLIGTQFDPGFIGVILVMTLLVSRNFIYFSDTIKKVLQLLLVLAVALTFSRSTYLALLISLFYIVVIEFYRRGAKKVLWWIILACWLGILIPLIPKPTGEGVNLLRTSTAVSRTSRSQEILSSMSPLQWVIGKGLFVPIAAGQPQYGANGEVIPDHARFADNLGIMLVSSVGILGTMLLIGVCIQLGWRWKNNLPIMSLLIAVLVHSLFNNTIFNPFIWILLWTAIASEVLKREEQTGEHYGL